MLASGASDIKNETLEGMNLKIFARTDLMVTILQA